MIHRHSYDDWVARMSDFHPGDRVIYRGNNEEGTVTSKNSRYVFVKFRWSADNGIACHPDDLDVLPHE